MSALHHDSDRILPQSRIEDYIEYLQSEHPCLSDDDPDYIDINEEIFMLQIILINDGLKALLKSGVPLEVIKYNDPTNG
jgi:hypothetical protein